MDFIFDFNWISLFVLSIFLINISDDKLNDIIVNKAKLWLDPGNIFGPYGKLFERINIACPLSLLKKALNNLYNALKEEILNEKE